MIKTRDLAETYMDAARTLFLLDGEVAPVVAFHGGPTSMLVTLKPNPRFNPADQAVAITFALGTVFEATHMIAVNETWMKKFSEDDQPENMERGELERLHKAGDMGVHTAILVIAANFGRHEDSLVMTRDVDDASDDEDSAGWSEKDLHLGSGSYLDRLLNAWERGKEVKPPPGGRWMDVAATLAKLEVISSVVHFGPGDDVEDVMRRAKAGEN